jgi:hypothetical protein
MWQMWQMKEDACVEENRTRTKPRPKELVGRQRSHTDDHCSSSSAMPHLMLATQRDWDAVDAEPTPQDLASLIGDGRRMRHVHARRATGFSHFVQRQTNTPPYCSQAGNKELYQWLLGEEV